MGVREKRLVNVTAMSEQRAEKRSAFISQSDPVQAGNVEEIKKKKSQSNEDSRNVLTPKLKGHRKVSVWSSRNERIKGSLAFHSIWGFLFDSRSNVLIQKTLPAKQGY